MQAMATRLSCSTLCGIIGLARSNTRNLRAHHDPSSFEKVITSHRTPDDGSVHLELASTLGFLLYITTSGRPCFFAMAGFLARKHYAGVLAVLLFLFYWKVSTPASKATSLSNMLKSFSSCPHDAKVERYKTSRAHRIANFLEGPGLAEWHDESIPDATCKFRKTSHHSEQHLPHAMQQLYRCFSWWHANPQKQPVLLSPPVTDVPYVQGFLKMLQDVIHLKIVTEREGRKAVRPIVDYSFHGMHQDGGYKMRSPGDFDELRKKVKLFYQEKLPEHAGCPEHTGPRHDGSERPLPLPVVTILNRRAGSGRHLLYAEELQKVIQKEFGVKVKLVDSMDGLDFMQQIQVMQSSDILISPHGAQWTTVPFLPRCSHSFEIFPEGYVTPKFYGSLAASASHSYWFVAGEANRMGDLETRRDALAQQVCLSPNTLQGQFLPSLRNAIHEWQQCCGHRIISVPQQSP